MNERFFCDIVVNLNLLISSTSVRSVALNSIRFDRYGDIQFQCLHSLNMALSRISGSNAHRKVGTYTKTFLFSCQLVRSFFGLNLQLIRYKGLAITFLNLILMRIWSCLIYGSLVSIFVIDICCYSFVIITPPYIGLSCIFSHQQKLK